LGKQQVTAALPFRRCAPLQMVVYYRHENRDFTFSSINTNLSYERSVTKMKPTASMRIRASRFLTDRYAYRERPDYLIELVAFGIIVITAILSLANAMATLR
jgi:hypothetical protein